MLRVKATRELHVPARSGRFEQHEWSRSHHRPAWEHIGRGNHWGTHEALADAQAATIVCGKRDCDAVVDLSSAKRLAKKAGRDELVPGDGCSAPECAARFRPARYVKAQASMLAGLANGNRRLVVCNEKLADKRQWRCTPCETRKAAAAAREQAARHAKKALQAGDGAALRPRL